MKSLYLYIDPGTGAMLFSVLMGIVSVVFFALKGLVVKLKFILSRGKTDIKTEEKLPFVIFAESKRYWNVFKPICDEFEKRGVECHYWTTSKDDPSFDENYKSVIPKFIGEGNKGFAALNFMKADVCLATTPGLDVFQWKRSREVSHYCHITHDIVELVMYRVYGIDYYDSVLLPNDLFKNAVREIEAKRNNVAKKELVTVGSVYMDELNKKKQNLDKEAAHSDRNIEKNNSDNKVIMLAPTWGKSSALSRFGERLIQALVDTGYKIIIRPHPQSFTSDADLMKRLMTKFPETENLEWNRDNNNFNVMNRTDVMISDYSSVIFDYSYTFTKPVIYVDTDLDFKQYDANFLDRPVWNIDILSRIGKKLTEENIDNIKEIIDEIADNEAFRNEIEKVRDIAWEHKGEAAVRAVDFLIEKQKEITSNNSDITNA